MSEIPNVSLVLQISKTEIFLGKAHSSREYKSLLKKLKLNEKDCSQSLSVVSILGVSDVKEKTSIVDFCKLNKVGHFIVDDLEDNQEPQTTLTGHRNLKEVHAFINQAILEEKPKIFIHCKMGQSPSACMFISYLIKEQGYTYDKAIKLVLSERENLSLKHINQKFRAELAQYEEVDVNENKEKSSAIDASPRETKRKSGSSKKKEEKTASHDKEKEVIFKKRGRKARVDTEWEPPKEIMPSNQAKNEADQVAINPSKTNSNIEETQEMKEIHEEIENETKKVIQDEINSESKKRRGEGKVKRNSTGDSTVNEKVTVNLKMKEDSNSNAVKKDNEKDKAESPVKKNRSAKNHTRPKSTNAVSLDNYEDKTPEKKTRSNRATRPKSAEGMKENNNVKTDIFEVKNVDSPGKNTRSSRANTSPKTGNNSDTKFDKTQEVKNAESPGKNSRAESSIKAFNATKEENISEKIDIVEKKNAESPSKNTRSTRASSSPVANRDNTETDKVEDKVDNTLESPTKKNRSTKTNTRPKSTTALKEENNNIKIDIVAEKTAKVRETTRRKIFQKNNVSAEK